MELILKDWSKFRKRKQIVLVFSNSNNGKEMYKKRDARACCCFANLSRYFCSYRCRRFISFRIYLSVPVKCMVERNIS